MSKPSIIARSAIAAVAGPRRLPPAATKSGVAKRLPRRTMGARCLARCFLAAAGRRACLNQQRFASQCPLHSAAHACCSPAQLHLPCPRSLFVRFLHTASPYVAGHRGRTFVVTIPGEVVARKERLYPLLEGALQLQLCPGGKGSTRQGTAQDGAGRAALGLRPGASVAAVSGVSRVCRCSIGCEGQPI